MTLTPARPGRFGRQALRRKSAPPRAGIPAHVQSLESRVLMAADFRISEFMAANVSTLADEDAQFNDWIEIRNQGDIAGSLAGYRLTDTASLPSLWTFPSISVPAGGHLVVFASGKNRTDPAANLHTNFSLNADGEYLALVAPDGSKRTEFAPRFPDQEEDVSYGADPAAAGQPLRYFARPTPGAPNARAEVVINEIHYDPDVKVQLVEFIELHNPGSAPVDLSAAFFSEGITYTFAQGTSLAPGGYLVLAQDAAQFQAKYLVTPFGQYDGSLSNEGETVRLRNRSRGVLDFVDYRPGFPWPTVGDAPGNSIELVNPDFDNDVGGNWRAQPPAVGVGVTLFASRTNWQYLPGTDEASNPVTAWRQLGFDDGSWSSGAGPIGYDEGGVPMGVTLPMRNAYTSVFLRKTFNVANPGEFGALRLEAMFDDGFNVWINGSFAYGQNVPGAELPYNGTAGSAIEDATYRPFNLPLGSLRAGQNVIAVQFFNASINNSSDAYFDARLTATTGGGVSPTPGRRNSVYADNVAPQMRQVNVTPEQPRGGEVVTITAKITDPDGVAGATLRYQVVTPGNYINIDDPAYQTSWTDVTMLDNGINGDAVAGDDIYSAQLPASVNQHRNLVRYRVSTSDTRGAAVTAPYADDSVPNFAYFVYDGVPGWTGSARPGVSPSVAYDPTLTGSMPAYHLISKNSDVEDATWNDRYGGDNYLWKGTLVYDGVVYDHIRYRARGGVWRYAMGKNMWKFDFNHNHGFQARDDYGNPYPVKWDKLNLSAIIQQAPFGHRGEQGLFESVGMALFNLAGVPAPVTNFLQFRVIDDSAEYVNQYNGDLWGLYLAVEQPDGQFLDQHGLPDGNLYKMEGGTGELNNQGPTHPTNKSDLIAFQNGYRQPGQTDQWFRDNMNLDSYYGYRAIVEAIHHYDIDESAGKNYFFYHNPVTDKWETTVWDLDLTWSNNMYGGGDEPFRDVVLPRAAFSTEYKNRVRELRDLLFNPDQTGALIDEMAAKIWTRGQPSWVDIDRAVWDWNPVMADPNRTHSDRGGQGRFYTGYGGQVIPTPGGFEGMMNKMKNYASAQSNQRGAYLDTIANDAAIPNKPTVTYQGPAGFPADRLRFRSSAFADPQGAGTFAAMKWRLAEVTNPSAPGYEPKAPKKYEINALWESGELTTFSSDVDIPAQYVREGKTYRVRVRMKDATGKWSKWSDAAQFVAGAPDQTVKDALRITEINYHPAANPSGPPAEDEFEFVELQNTSATVINLRDVQFTNGIEYTFGDVSLLPGAYIVVARNRDAFAQRYGDTGVLADGVFTRSLDNASDHLTLIDATNQVIHDFTYFDTWHPTTDGEGPTMVVVDRGQPLEAWDTAAGWRPSTAIHGSPGRDDGGADVTPPSVDITDITPDPRNAAVTFARFVFSEPVTGFDLTDVVLTRDGGASLLTAAQTLSSTDGGRTWTLNNLAALTGASGAYSLRVVATGSAIEDAAGNALVNGAADNWTTDAAAPTVDIVDVTPDPRTTGLGSITIVFSEPITGFDRTDLTLTRNGGPNLLAVANVLSSSDGGRTWVLGGLTNLVGTEGTYLLTLAAAGNGIADGAGNTLAGGATERWVMDVTAPRADIIDVAPDPRSTPVESVTIVFTEPVIGFDLPDLQLIPRHGDGGNLLTAEQTLTTSDDGRTWTLGNLAGLTGPLGGGYAVALSANDSVIRDAAGNLMIENAFEDWYTAAVFGRHVFYNGSTYDGRNGAATAADDGAIATDKIALLPGAGSATFANYTSYSRGTNGVMIDIAGLPVAAVRGLNASDFVFKVGNGADPSTWVNAPAPLGVATRWGAGVGGSDRVTLTWADGAIRNQWLQVTVRPNAVTGLPSADVFYFGNLVGETGDSATAAVVTAADFTATRSRLTALSGVTGRHDFNRDGRVNSLDLSLVRGSMFGTIPLLTPPAGAVGVASFGEARIASSGETSGPVATGSARTKLAARRAWYEQPADVLS